MTRGGAWACPRSVRMLVSRRPLRSEYTNSRSVSFTVTLRKGSSKATDGSGLAFTTQRHCTVSRAAAQWDSKRITGATAGARQDPVGWRWGLGAFWAGMSCPCLCTLVCACSVTSVVSDSLRPHGLKPARLLCPWDSPGKNPGVGSRALLQGIFPIQRLNLCLLHFLHGQQILYH